MSHPIINIGRYHGGSDCWRTPPLLFKNLHQEFSFSMDGAATEHDALLPRFTDDISRQSWDGERVFCNPPFSMAEQFLSRAPEADVCVCLVPHRSKTTYWLRCVYTNPFLHEIRTLHRAVKYLPPAGKKGAVVRSPFASCVLIYRNTPRKPKVEVTQTIYCGDTMLLLAVVNRGGLRGRPHVHDAQTLDRFIKLYMQGKPIKYIADALRMPLSTSYRIAQRLS
ncbi:DNA methylase [Escherichia coli]|uniref:DNA N-6-adenine-methyltransferase n=1 Tax=Escherichia coli TaxID=562 RepID=UPI000EF8B289|nr:DNA N-6-adenine-methyltransferase [Escherichia coli]MDU0216069.1 DNA N-6-adenine-methyltransferase [Escherichia coli]RLW99219.1 DNA methylase [Escherichia coli]RLX00767.1 DNA methylase [Escherichia coli]RLX04071.1 DNA methylase [Escherichia coli]